MKHLKSNLIYCTTERKTSFVEILLKRFEHEQLRIVFIMFDETEKFKCFAPPGGAQSSSSYVVCISIYIM